MYRTPEEVAGELQVTRRTVYEWLRTGRLRGLRAGRGWRIRPEDVDTFLHRDGASKAAATEEREQLGEMPDPSRLMTAEEILRLSPAERMDRNRAAQDVLDAFMAEDEAEQRATWEALKQALDEDRLSYRKLFP